MMFTFFFLCWSIVTVQYYVSFRCAIWWWTISKSYTLSIVTIKYCTIFPVPSISEGQPGFIWTLPVIHAPDLVLGRCHFAWPEEPFGFCWDSFSLSPTCIVLPIFSVCGMSNILQDIAGSWWIRRKVKSFSPSIQATYGNEVWNVFFDWNCLVIFLSFLIFISLKGKNKAAVSWLTYEHVHYQCGYLGECLVFHIVFQLMSKGDYILF